MINMVSRLGQQRSTLVLSLLLLLGAVAGWSVVSTGIAQAGPGNSTTVNLTVAFIGDQGLTANSMAVLELIRDEGADMVMHQGDFDYIDGIHVPEDVDAWTDQIDEILGPTFPYFAALGNHDTAEWEGAGGYQEAMLDRLSLISGATCVDDYGLNSACTYQGLFFILSGAGSSYAFTNNNDIPVREAEHVAYIEDQLTQTDAVWRICAWHKTQHELQLGAQRVNEVYPGWGVYEECRQGGAIIATAHEHAYQRTKTLTNTELQTLDPLWPDASEVRVGGGSTFVFVSGLGGKSISNQDRCLPTTLPYGCGGEWAFAYTSDQGANFGALFCVFNVGGIENKAHCYFKNINGVIVDEFDVWATALAAFQVPGLSAVGLGAMAAIVAGLMLWAIRRSRAARMHNG